MNDDGTRYVGPSFLTLLGILFIGLKLTGFIEWPWWLVLAPVWGGFLLAVVFIVVAVVIGVWLEHRSRPW